MKQYVVEKYAEKCQNIFSETNSRKRGKNVRLYRTRHGGGFIVQLMPFVEESVINRLEQNLRNINSVTSMLDAGSTPEQMLEQLFD